MKIVHLCTQDFGGAGIAAFRLHKGLLSLGFDSKFIVLDKKNNDPSVLVIPENLDKLNVCIVPDSYKSQKMYSLWVYWDRLMAQYKQRPVGCELFTDITSVADISLVKEIQEADIINFHWVAGMLDFPNLSDALKGKNIVWTLHDMNPFTGGCHYTGDCKKFEDECNSCLQLGSVEYNDLSHRNFLAKNNAFSQMQISIVTPSKWLGIQAAKSKLFNNFKVSTIPYGLPLQTFKNHSKLDLKKEYNIPPTHKIILFGADYVTNKRKGFKLLIEALDELYKKGIKDILLGVFGVLGENTIDESKFPVIKFGPISSEETLSKIYSMADVFVVPSLEDNLPNTVLESLACGTPVVGFNIGGIPDMVKHKETGYLAEKGDVKDLANGIKWVLNSKKYNKISKLCRKVAEEKYDLSIQANSYIDLYKSLLLKKNNDSKIEESLIPDDGPYKPVSFKHSINSHTDVVVATTIAPHKIQKQLTAVKSWENAGLKVISVNTKEEIILLEKNFPTVQFIQAERNGIEEFGKPFIYLDDIFKALLDTNCKYCGIINSDIILNTDTNIISFIKEQPEKSLTYGSRLDIRDYTVSEGKYYEFGFDYFFFFRDFISVYPKSKFCLGLPWWDYWMLTIPLLKHYKTIRVISPVALHLWHETNYDHNYWINLGDYYIKLLVKNGLFSLSEDEVNKYGVEAINSYVSETFFLESFKLSNKIEYNNLKRKYSYCFPSVNNSNNVSPEDFFNSFFTDDSNQVIKRESSNIKLEYLIELYKNGMFDETIMMLGDLVKKNLTDLVLYQYYVISLFFKDNIEPLNYCVRNLNMVSHNDSLTKNIVSRYNNFITNSEGYTKIKVSAIVSTYKSEKFIEKCLEDLMEQSLYKKGELEIIVVDSGSPENEYEIVNRYQKNNKNIYCFRTDHRETIYQAWNRGVLASTGKFITNANTDDRHSTDALEKMANFLEENESVGVVYANSYITNVPNDTFNSNTPKGKYNWIQFDKDFILFGCFIGPQPMWRKSIHDKCGYFDENLKVVGDYEFWLRISQDVNFYHLDEYLGLYYASNESAEHRDNTLTEKENIEVREKYFKKYVKTADDIARIKIKLDHYKKVSNDQNYYDAAMSFLNKLISEVELEKYNNEGNQSDFQSLFLNAYNYYTDKQFVTALSSIENAEKVFMQNESGVALEDVYLLKGYICLALNNTDEARQAFETALQNNPNSSDACKGLGDIFFIEKMYPEAKTMYEWAVKNNSNNTDAEDSLLKVNNILSVSSSPNSSVNLSNNQMEDNETEFDATVKSSYLKLENKEYESALLALYEAEDIYDENASNLFLPEDVCILRGTIYLEIRKYEKAQIAFEKALNINPQSSEACRGLGEVFYKSDLMNESKVMFEWAVKNDPGNSQAAESLEKVNSVLGLVEADNTLLK
jgi:glycosyltransferase involved in cell wall biosynthesis/Tfp pilus assembly protein PilF